MDLAYLDFNLTPSKLIYKQLDCTHSHVYTMRQDELYKKTVEELTLEHKRQLLSNPQTKELRDLITGSLGRSLRKLYEAAADPETSTRDQVAIAKLMGAMDGRFSVSEPGEAEQKDSKEVAAQLMQLINRDKTVQ
jgi:hypothetical protein